MRRIALYNYYSEKGELEEYARYSLRDLSYSMDRIILVVNGNMDYESIKAAKEFCDDIVIRKNAGYDAAAFKYVLLEYLPKEYLLNVDELYMVNSSFFGPFIPWKDIINTMDVINCDFWGINSRDNGVLQYVQSFIWCFRKTILSMNVLNNYFSKYIYDEADYNLVCASYEIGLSRYLLDRGYRFATYCKASVVDLYRNSFISLSEYGVPILKKKCFDSKFFSEDVLLSLLWINDNTKYDVSLIYKSDLNLDKLFTNIKKEKLELYEKNKFAPIPKLKCSRIRVCEFIRDQKRIFIWGTGWWGLCIYYSFFIESDIEVIFVVSDDEHRKSMDICGKRVFTISEIVERYNTGRFIVATSFSIKDEVLEVIPSYFDVLTIW